VEKEGFLDEKEPVTFLRVFELQEAEKRGVEVTGWKTFDQLPELILYEGYLTKANEAFLKPTTAKGFAQPTILDIRLVKKGKATCFLTSS
jgi:hypothetical protein